MIERPRRNRRSSSIRALVREHRVTADDLIVPLFLAEGEGQPVELTSLTGNYIWTKGTILGEIESCLSLGLRTFILFPKVDASHKDKTASYGCDPANFYLRSATEIKSKFPEATLISDVAMDPYSVDGHDGLVADGSILNDETLDILADMSIAQAEAGFDILGPSDMMDGRVGFIREALDDAGYSDTGIMSYTAKYASAFYGPFRDALDSAPVDDPTIPSDKSTYQMDPANVREAIREADLDTAEGADYLMVKPALHYLDVIQTLRRHSELPIAAYHVSGECAMLAAAIKHGYLDRDKAIAETLLSIKRAGADAIISYFAKAYVMQPE
ncbi:MAG: porphobilinogen synthase [Bacteroidota bacterium]